MTGPVAGLSVWERAELEVEQTQEVSAETARAILDLQGVRGIFDQPEHFEALRAALGRKIRDHRILRAFELPQDIEPILNFEA